MIFKLLFYITGVTIANQKKHNAKYSRETKDENKHKTFR